MYNPELLHNPEILRSAEHGAAEFDSRSQERFLGVDERDEALLAATAVLGPLATMLAHTDGEPYRPMFEARPPATAAEVANTVDFVPPVEFEAPAWRDARRDTGAAAIMFAWERSDMSEHNHEDLALAA